LYIIRELFRNLYRNPGTALGSFLSLTLLFLLFNLFWVGVGTSERFYVDLISQLQMDVFLDEQLPDSAIGDLTFTIEGIDGVNLVAYISKEDARQELSHRIGTDLLVGYDSINPLPRSYILTFEPESLNLTDMVEIEQTLTALPGVMDIDYSRRWLEKLEETKSILLHIGLALGAMIALTALISSANNIRLMTRARAVGFRQMSLLGAGRLFIGLPFLIEGFLMAGLAAGAGWFAIVYGRQQLSFTRFDIVMPTREEMVLFCIGCAIIGLVSGYLGVRRQMKE
jgi:cell division protein FtsX